MAKDKSPKKMLGVRIPKTVRKMDWLFDIVESEIGRQILADVLLAAAAAAAAALVAPRSGSPDNAKATDNPENKASRLMKDVVKSATDAATGTLAGAAKQMLTGERRSTAKRQRAPRRSS